MQFQPTVGREGVLVLQRRRRFAICTHDGAAPTRVQSYHMVFVELFHTRHQKTDTYFMKSAC